METKKINGKAVVSLILSCLSVLCCFAWYLAIIVGMIGVVLGIIEYRESEGGQRDLAIVSAVLYIMLTSGPADSLQTTPVSPSAIGVPSASPEPSAFPDDDSGSMMFALRKLRIWL